MDLVQAPVSAGDILAGKYRVDRVLGVGGMGVVVAATHVTLDQKVALKFMLPHALGNAEAVARFVREARNAVRLRSEHVARIIDVSALDNGAPYIVMEYLEGIDLGGYLQLHGALPTAVAAEFVLQACEAIAEAHALGIVHRDLKPPNLFVTRAADGSPLIKVLDFGIAKAGVGDLQITRTQAVMGSPGYMSPEQMRSSKSADARSDIWAIGVILYQLASGTMPFDADTFTELVVRVTMDPPPPLPIRGRDVPPGFEAVIRRCLEKDPTLRFQTVAELAIALAPYVPSAATSTIEKINRILAPVAAVSQASATGNPWAKTTLGDAAGQVAGGRRPRRTLAIGAVVAVFAGGVIFAVGMFGGGVRSTDVAPPVPAKATEPPPPAAPPANASTEPPAAATPSPDASTEPLEVNAPTEPPPAVASPAKSPTKPPPPAAAPARSSSVAPPKATASQTQAPAPAPAALSSAPRSPSPSGARADPPASQTQKARPTRGAKSATAPKPSDPLATPD